MKPTLDIMLSTELGHRHFKAFQEKTLAAENISFWTEAVELERKYFRDASTLETVRGLRFATRECSPFATGHGKRIHDNMGDFVLRGERA